jgi:Mg2+-importing ATPase
MTWRKTDMLKTSREFNINTARLKNVCCNEEAKLFSILSTLESGLTDDIAAQRLDDVGLNEVQHEKNVSWFRQLVDAFINPFIGILVFIAVISAIIDIWMPQTGDEDYSTVVMVCVMVLISVSLRFFQEFKSNNAAQQLKEMVETTASVLRDNVKKEIDMRQLVPGDIISLSAGDMIPADCRIIRAKDLFVIQSALTGESLPVEKRAIVVDAAAAARLSPLELENACFMGTNVVSGSAIACRGQYRQRDLYGFAQQVGDAQTRRDQLRPRLEEGELSAHHVHAGHGARGFSRQRLRQGQLV